MQCKRNKIFSLLKWYYFIEILAWYKAIMWGWCNNFIISISLKIFFRLSSSKWVLSIILMATCKRIVISNLIETIIITLTFTYIFMKKITSNYAKEQNINLSYPVLNIAITSEKHFISSLISFYLKINILYVQ